MDDRLLVEQLRRGHQGAADELVRKYQGFVFAVALKLMGNRHEAEELASDALVKALLKIDSFKGQASLKSWLYRITYNACMSALRGRKATVELSEVNTPTYEDETEALEAEGREEKLHRAIEDLKPDDKALIALFYFDKKSLDQVAEILGLTVSNAKVRLHRVRERLKKRLQHELWAL